MSTQLLECGDSQLPEAQEFVKGASQQIVVEEPCLTDEPVSSAVELDSGEDIECGSAQPATAEVQASTETVDFVNVVREDLVKTMAQGDRSAYVFVVPVLDGKLYIGTAADQAALNKLIGCGTISDGSITYQIDKDISPLVLPNKSKWDLTKYACLLVDKYGWDNVIFSEAQFEEVRCFYNSLSKPKREEVERNGVRRKKLIFKGKAARPWLNIRAKVTGMLSVFKRILTRRPRN